MSGPSPSTPTKILPVVKDLVESAVIVCDTREQDPLGVSQFPMVSTTLPVGDYGISGFSDWDNPQFIAERKSLADLVGSLTARRQRFFRELRKMRQFGFRCLLIEASKEDVADATYSSNATPKSLLASLDAIAVRMNVHVFWCGDHDGAARQLEGLVRQFIRGIENDCNSLRKAAKASGDAA